jgi:hypothetical protein
MKRKVKSKGHILNEYVLPTLSNHRKIEKYFQIYTNYNFLQIMTNIFIDSIIPAFSCCLTVLSFALKPMFSFSLFWFFDSDIIRSLRTRIGSATHQGGHPATHPPNRHQKFAWWVAVTLLTDSMLEKRL